MNSPSDDIAKLTRPEKTKRLSRGDKKKEKIWCKHITFGTFRWIFFWVNNGINYSTCIPRSWRCCPICRKERPRVR